MRHPVGVRGRAAQDTESDPGRTARTGRGPATADARRHRGRGLRRGGSLDERGRQRRYRNGRPDRCGALASCRACPYTSTAGGTGRPSRPSNGWLRTRWSTAPRPGRALNGSCSRLLRGTTAPAFTRPTNEKADEQRAIAWMHIRGLAQPTATFARADPIEASAGAWTQQAALRLGAGDARANVGSYCAWCHTVERVFGPERAG
jgi:hypothetical protein